VRRSAPFGEARPRALRPHPARDRDHVLRRAGLSNREIARKLSLSEDTVKHHLTNIFNKMGASNRLELALFAVHHRLFD
jgi:DNA-binding NarL/FixJ family response regulator